MLSGVAFSGAHSTGISAAYVVLVIAAEIAAAVKKCFDFLHKAVPPKPF